MQQKRIITHNNYVESFSQMKVFYPLIIATQFMLRFWKTFVT